MSLSAFFFFFSSRRRHTRLVSDWSSDVCSSDLGVRCFPQIVDDLALAGDDLQGRLENLIVVDADQLRSQLFRRLRFLASFRAEERRVGKEWSVLGWPCL